MSAASDFIGGAAKIWTSGVTYKQGAIVLSPASNYQAYVRITAAGSGATDPASDTTNYRPFGARAIKSIQRGTVTVVGGTAQGNATITSVDTAKSVLEYLGGMGLDATASAAWIPILTLTSSTNVRATAPGNVVAGGIGVGYQVTEYY